MEKDNDLLSLFKEEAQERIRSAKEALQLLLSDFSLESIDALMRDIHTIKGSSGMLHETGIERKCHEFEQLLEPFRDKKMGAGDLTENLLTTLFDHIDEIEKLILLCGETQTLPSSASKEKQVKTGASSQPKTSNEEKHTQTSQTTPAPSLASTHIKVTKKQLNEIMSQAGELTVTKNRVATFVDHVEIILSSTQKAIRNFSVFKFTHKDPQIIFNKMEEEIKELERELSNIRETTYESVYKLNFVTETLVDSIKRLGLVPLRRLFEPFDKIVENLSISLGKQVVLEVVGEDITVDKKIIEEMKEPLVHLIRNAVAHGIEPPQIREQKGKDKVGNIALRANQITGSIVIEIEDDGNGLDAKKLKKKGIDLHLITAEEAREMSDEEAYQLIFYPHFTTADQVSEVAGRGAGLDMVKAHIEAIRGKVGVSSQKGKGTTFFIEFPTTVLTDHVFLVAVEDQVLGIPIEAIEYVQLIDIEKIYQVDQKDIILFEEQPVILTLLAPLLGLHAYKDKLPTLVEREHPKLHCLLLNLRGRRLGVVVDAILDEQQVVIVPVNKHLTNMPYISGATVLKDGKVSVILDPMQLMREVDAREDHTLSELKEKLSVAPKRRKILLIDDSYAFRMYCKKLIEDAGYEVTLACDGLEGLHLYEKTYFDAIIADYKMPGMDGFTFTRTIREDKEDEVTPIIILTTSDLEEKRREGISAGADAYITKTSAYQKELVHTLKNLII